MKFASFRVNGQDTYGVALSDTRIVDLRASGGADVPENLLAFIEAGDSALGIAADILDNPATAVAVDADQIE